MSASSCLWVSQWTLKWRISSPKINIINVRGSCLKSQTLKQHPLEKTWAAALCLQESNPTPNLHSASSSAVTNVTVLSFLVPTSHLSPGSVEGSLASKASHLPTLTQGQIWPQSYHLHLALQSPPAKLPSKAPWRMEGPCPRIPWAHSRVGPEDAARIDSPVQLCLGLPS